MNWRKFNKKSELWVGFLFLIIAQPFVLKLYTDNWLVIGNTLNTILIVFLALS